jgi:predicted nuclease of predicted toxin-antitoxin system
MKIKLDENLPLRLADLLRDLGHDVQTVHEERLVGQNDTEIWEAAQKESRFLITQDLDFSDSRKFVPGSHHGILLVRLHSPNRRNLIERIVELFPKEPVGNGLAVLLSPQNVRSASSGARAARILRVTCAAPRRVADRKWRQESRPASRKAGLFSARASVSSSSLAVRCAP